MGLNGGHKMGFGGVQDVPDILGGLGAIAETIGKNRKASAEAAGNSLSAAYKASQINANDALVKARQAAEEADQLKKQNEAQQRIVGAAFEGDFDTASQTLSKLQGKNLRIGPTNKPGVFEVKDLDSGKTMHYDYLAKKRAESEIVQQRQVATAAAKPQTPKEAPEDKALTQTISMLEGARGNPAAQQAERDLYAASKANSLATLYKDPNNLSERQVKLYVSEIGKIAQGGVPTVSELEGLTPNTVNSALSKQFEKLQNAPTAANLGEFIKQYQEYTNSLTKDAQKTITEKYGRIIESRKKQLGDDNYKTLQDQYLNRFTSAEPVPTPQAQAGGEVKRLTKDGQTAVFDAATKKFLRFE